MPQHPIMVQLNAHIAYLKLNYATLAPLMFKDKSTIRKQLNSDAMNLNTIQEYLDVIGGRLVLETPESRDAFSNPELNNMQIALAELAAENNRLKERLNEKDLEISEKKERIYSLEDALLKGQAAMRKNQQIILEKEEKILQFLYE